VGGERSTEPTKISIELVSAVIAHDARGRMTPP